MCYDFVDCVLGVVVQVPDMRLTGNKIPNQVGEKSKYFRAFGGIA